MRIYLVALVALLARPGSAHRGVATAVETTASAPIIADVAGVTTAFVGTSATADAAPAAFTGADDVDAFEYPAVVGHFRGLSLGMLGRGATGYTSPAGARAVRFDAALTLPAERRLFTDTGVHHDPDETMLAVSQRATLAPLLGVAERDADALIAHLHAGRKVDGGRVPALGGIDRSIPAIIEASPALPVPRPTVAYVGARDGMLHAFCVEVTGACETVGQELWAFLPSSELGKVKTHQARVDGSPVVADVTDADGRIRTVLVFQTGNAAPAATYALDVTDPANPDVMWKVETDGPGTRAVIGRIADRGPTSITVVQSARADGGFELAALATLTGEVRWRRSVAPRAPGAAVVPAGATLVTAPGAVVTALVLAPAPDGRLFALDARTGENPYGDAPLFDAGADHPLTLPVALYRDDELRALVVSEDLVVSVPVVVDPARLPLTADDVARDPALGMFRRLGRDQRVVAPAVIAGDQAFVVSASRLDPAAPARLWRSTLGGAVAFSMELDTGAGAIDVSLERGIVLASAPGGVLRVDPEGFDRIGVGTELRVGVEDLRKLWWRPR